MTRDCLPNRRAAGLRAITNIAWKQCDGGIDEALKCAARFPLPDWSRGTSETRH